MGIGWGGMGEGLGGGVLGVTLIGNGRNRPVAAIGHLRIQGLSSRREAADAITMAANGYRVFIAAKRHWLSPLGDSTGRP